MDSTRDSDDRTDSVTLRAVLESTPDPTAILRAVRAAGTVADWHFVEANEALCRHVDRERDQVVGHRLTEVQPQTDSERIRLYSSVLDTGDELVWRDVEFVRYSDGAVIVVDFRCHRIDDNTLSMTFRDVSDRARAEQALRQSEERFRTAMAASPIGFCLVGPEGQFLQVNDALCQFLGRDEATVLASTWQEITHPDDLELDLSLVEEVLRGDRDTYRIRKRYLRPDGAVRWGDLAVGCVRAADGSVVHFISQITDITDWVVASAEVSASQEQYRLLAENASDLVFRSDSDLRLTWVSPSITALLGLTPGDVVGRSVIELIFPEDLPRLRRAAAETADGEAITYRARFRTAWETTKWLAITARAVFDDDGVLVGRIGSGRDIDAEQEALAALTEQRDFLTAVIDSELDARVFVAPVRDGSGRIVDLVYREANPLACRYLDVPAEKLLGAQMLEIFPGQRDSGLFDRYVTALETGRSLTVDDMPLVSDVVGTPQWIGLRAVVVGDTLSVTWRTVTERHTAQALLAESEERFRLLAHNVSDIVSLAGPDGALQWVSPSVERVLGWRPEEWVGRPIDNCVHPDDLDSLRQRRSAVASGSELTGRTRLRDREGAYHWVYSRATPFLDADGTPRGVIAVLTIIDDQVAHEEALAHQATHDQLTGLLNRKEVYRRLTALLSHDARRGSRTFVAFIDLDNLKAVNDLLGHAAGDELLRVVARRIGERLRDEDLVARVGGDELLVVLPGIVDEHAAVSLMQELLARVGEPHTGDDGHLLQPRMSIGLTEVRAHEGVETAVHRADTAMYAAKNAGGNRVRLADRHLDVS